MDEAREPRSRNGFRHGDVSYVTIGVPHLARARAFYGSVLGWTFTPGASDAEKGSSVDEIVPMVGLWAGELPRGATLTGTVLGFRVDDVDEAVRAVRAAGGSATEPAETHWGGRESEAVDGQGLEFYLHEMRDDPRPAPRNGAAEGDVSYISIMGVDVPRARRFFSETLGWGFDVGQPGGTRVTDVVPEIGLSERGESPRVVLGFRVDDISAAVDRVRTAGGAADDPAHRPYGLESRCDDDQGLEFYLHQVND